jgi:hypothetical protein
LGERGALSACDDIMAALSAGDMRANALAALQRPVSLIKIACFEVETGNSNGVGTAKSSAGIRSSD